MTIDDIRVKTSFRGHRKRRRLNMMLNKQPSGTDYLMDLWIATAENHPNGILQGMDEMDISLEAGWEGDPSEFVKALVDSGFLEKNGNGVYQLHDWEEHQGWVVHAKERSQRAREAAQIRWANLEENKEVNADSMQDGCNPHAECNAPSPNPSPSPSPSPDTGIEDNTSRDQKPDPPCPHQKIIDLWHEMMPELPKVKAWGGQRESDLRARWRENKKRQNLEWWRRSFQYIRNKCPFLMGEVSPRSGRKTFYATLPWIVKRENFLKIIEGNYEER